MSKTEYYYPKGGLPKRGKILIGQAVFKEAYAVIPREVMTDIVTLDSFLSDNASLINVRNIDLNNTIIIEKSRAAKDGFNLLGLLLVTIMVI